jgi:CRP/FNR family cyclic AMP-dependent transcriptional regulator
MLDGVQPEEAIVSIDELRTCIVATPFQSFVLNIADGRRIAVFGRNFIRVPPERGRTGVSSESVVDASTLSGSHRNGICGARAMTGLRIPPNPKARSAVGRPAKVRASFDNRSISGVVHISERQVEMSIQKLVDAFKSHEFLRGLSDRHLMLLASGAVPFDAEAGELLAREGDTANAFYLIQSGHVALGTRAAGQTDVQIQRAGPGDVVGWSWLVPPHRWQFDCRAVGEVKGIKFNAEWLRNLCEQDHELSHHLFKHLASVLASRLEATRRQLHQHGK